MSVFRIALFAGLGLAQMTHAEPLPNVVDLQTGVFCAPAVASLNPAPDTVAGVTNFIAEDPDFLIRANVLPAARGVGFGIKARLAEGSGPVSVVIHVTHPPMGENHITRQDFAATLSATTLSPVLYQFDHDYELLPGQWTMRAEYQGQTLFESTFLVVPQRSMETVAASCALVDLIS